MKSMRGPIGPEDFFAKDSHLDSAMAATGARALVWQLMHEAVQTHPSHSTTLADLSAAVTRSAARILDMSEDDLAQLLRDHPAH